MLTKVIETGSIEILVDGQMQVREDTVVYEDDVELSRTYLRYVLSPGEDVSARPKRVQDVSKVVWTPDVVSAWKSRIVVLP